MHKSTASIYYLVPTMRAFSKTCIRRASGQPVRRPMFSQQPNPIWRLNLGRNASLAKKKPSTPLYSSAKMNMTTSSTTSVRFSPLSSILAGLRLLIWVSSSKNSSQTPTTCSSRPWSPSIKNQSRPKPSRERRCRGSSSRMRLPLSSESHFMGLLIKQLDKENKTQARVDNDVTLLLIVYDE